jgi:hypothetical protein
VFVTWVTDVPASSQVRVIDLATGSEFSTVVDSNNVTNHQVIIGGLQAKHEYGFYALSIVAGSGENLVAGPQNYSTP